MLLQEIVQKKHYAFVERCDDWQDSIRKCCKPLKIDGIIDDTYEEEIINCVKEHGAYIVIIPGVCIPHSTEGSKGALKTAIGFMKSEEPVIFDANDSDKYAHIFFTLAATKKEEHMKNMKKLFNMLTNELLVADLLKVKTPNDLSLLDLKYFS